MSDEQAMLWAQRLLEEGLVETVNLSSCSCHAEIIDGVRYNFISPCCAKHCNLSPMYLRNGQNARTAGKRHSGHRGED